MTHNEKVIQDRYGKHVIEAFNIAHHHHKDVAPCTCTICVAVYDKLSQWFKERRNAGPAKEGRDAT